MFVTCATLEICFAKVFSFRLLPSTRTQHFDLRRVTPEKRPESGTASKEKRQKGSPNDKYFCATNDAAFESRITPFIRMDFSCVVEQGELNSLEVKIKYFADQNAR